jgi:hypothetical protein
MTLRLENLKAEENLSEYHIYSTENSTWAGSITELLDIMHAGILSFVVLGVKYAGLSK